MPCSPIKPAGWQIFLPLISNWKAPLSSNAGWWLTDKIRLGKYWCSSKVWAWVRACTLAWSWSLFFFHSLALQAFTLVTSTSEATYKLRSTLGSENRVLRGNHVKCNAYLLTIILNQVLSRNSFPEDESLSLFPFSFGHKAQCFSCEIL